MPERSRAAQLSRFFARPFVATAMKEVITMAPRPKIENTGEVAELETAPATAPTVETPEVTPESNDAEVETNGDNGDENGDTNRDLETERKKLLSEVAQIGGQYGTGKRALVNLAIAVVDAAQAKAINVKKAPKRKDGSQPDDHATAIYRKFKGGAEKKAGNVVADAELGAKAGAGSWNVQVSKLRSLIKLGQNWQDDAANIVADTIEVHSEMLKGEADLKITSTYTGLVGIAREHMKRTEGGHRMTKEEIHDFFLAPESKVKTGVDLIEDAIKTLKRAQNGKKAKGDVEAREAIEHESIQHAIDHLRNVIADVDPNRWQEIVEEENKAAAEASATAEDEASDEE